MLRPSCDRRHANRRPILRLGRRLAAAVLPLALSVSPLALPGTSMAADDVPPRPFRGFDPAVDFRWAPVAPAPADKTPAAPVRVPPLDDRSLGEALRQAGFKVGPVTDDGRTVYLVTADRRDVQVRVWVGIDPSRKQVGFEARLTSPADPDSPAAAAGLARLLAENIDIGPAYFALKPDAPRLRLLRQLPVDGTTPAGLAAALRTFVDTVVDTAPLWGRKWEPDAAADHAAPADQDPDRHAAPAGPGWRNPRAGGRPARADAAPAGAHGIVREVSKRSTFGGSITVGVGPDVEEYRITPATRLYRADGGTLQIDEIQPGAEAVLVSGDGFLKELRLVGRGGK